MRPNTADIEPVLPAVAPSATPAPIAHARPPQSAWQGRIGPLAILAAVLLHGTALLLFLSIRHDTLPPPPPAAALTLEVLPVPTQATTAASAEAATTPASEPAAAPPSPQAATVPPPPEQAANPPTQVVTAQPPVPESLDAAVPLVPSPPDAVSPTVPDEPAPESTMQVPPPTDATPVPLSPAQASIPLPPPEPPPPAPRRPSPPRHAARLRPTPEREASQAEAAPQPAPGPATSAPSASVPAPAPTPSSAAAPAAVSPSWQGQLSAWLQAHKSYPEPARERGEEGTASVRFTVARDGRVLAVSLVHGSGSELLDAAAQALLRGARVPPFPEAMPQSEITVTVAIRYSLER